MSVECGGFIIRCQDVCMMVIVIHVVFRVCACVIAMQRDFSWRETGILREKGLRGAFHKKGERVR